MATRFLECCTAVGPCQQERGKPHDPYTVAVMESVIVGHVPHEISAICSLFL